MNSEIEAKFLHIDHEDIRRKLTDIGATCVAPMRLMRRAIIDYPDRRMQVSKPNSYIRIRDEGDKITLTYKQFNSLSVDGAREVEVIVSSFDDAVKIFTSVGLEVVSLQESKRETWECDDCEIVLDEWPWLDPYIEIEADSEEKIKSFSSKLGLDWESAVFGDVMVAYRGQYPYLNDKQTIGQLPEVKFDAPFPDLLKESGSESENIARSYLGKEVRVKIDRPLGSKHPKHGFLYEVNYGFIEGVKAPDGEDLDAYYLGVNEPFEFASGVCVAIAHRKDDDDDKLIVIPKGFEISDDQIMEAINFQEKWFDTEIIR